MAGPLTHYSGSVSVTAGVITITIPNFQDGDVYLIYLNSTDILGQMATSHEDKLAVFPNPSSSSITLLTENRIYEPVIFINAVGETVKETVITSDEMTIDLTNLPAGIYYIKTRWQIIQFVKN
ncbi:MAG: T9SS type A sorting domain-containing protein [Crocinitomicaceae bacterium]|nr:T9SS type A sorting domain-containing protein [Crocinitomicaceae bacterium]